MDSFKPKWYTTSDFARLKAVDVCHKENCSVNINSAIKNYHVLARAGVNYSAQRSVLRITADDYYKLYINGRFICQGPSPSYHNSYYYNELDVTKYLDQGENVIALHLYYQGLINRVWQSGDNRFGVAIQLNGEDIRLKYIVSTAYSGDINGYDTDFTENFDSRKWDLSWNKKQYDDTEWQYMTEAKCDYNFISQPAKMLSVYTIRPETIQKRVGSYFIDVGQEIVGGVRISAVGADGDEVIIRYAEELTDDNALMYKLRAGCNYQEKWILADGESQFESYLYKGFRYVEIITDNEIKNIEVICRHYPFDDDYCVPIFSDYRAEQIFKLCKNTIKYAVQEGYIDCPTREKGQYIGDAFIAGHSHVLLTGDTSLLEKTIDEFAQSAEICDGLMAVAPCSLMQEIADYSLIFGEMVLLAYSFNHSMEFLQRYYNVIKNIIIHFKQFERDDGLLRQVKDKWNLVDWPENMRDDYDFELSRPVVADGVHNVINAYYIGAVRTLNEIESILGMPKSFDFDSLKSAYINAFMRDNMLFADSEDSNHFSLHSNVFALYFALVPDTAIDTVADYISGRGLSCGVYVSYFALKALSRVGRKKDVFNLLVNDSEHGWLNMINEGATTCFETWGKEQKLNTSLCHPWATAPISIILEDLKGESYVISDNE